MIDKLEQHTGHNANRLIVLIMQYGRDFSGPGNDVFRINRATGEPADAHNSNFLHPVFYYYEKLPTGLFQFMNLKNLTCDSVFYYYERHSRDLDQFKSYYNENKVFFEIYIN